MWIMDPLASNCKIYSLRFIYALTKVFFTALWRNWIIHYTKHWNHQFHVIFPFYLNMLNLQKNNISLVATLNSYKNSNENNYKKNKKKTTWSMLPNKHILLNYCLILWHVWAVPTLYMSLWIFRDDLSAKLHVIDNFHILYILHILIYIINMIIICCIYSQL